MSRRACANCAPPWASCSAPSAACAGATRTAPGELSATQVRALFQLERGEACTAGELAKRAELSPASMTAMLDQLEHDGMVERRRSDQDRRQVIVSLTDAGHETLAAKRAKHGGAHWHEVLGALQRSGARGRRARHALARRAPGLPRTE